MTLRITILGSGTSVPSASRRAPAYLVQSEETAFLLDCGSGATTSLARQNVGLNELSGVVLTHLHPDHTADLVPLIFALRNPLGPLWTGDLFIWGPPGIVDFFHHLKAVYGHWLELKEGKMKIIELVEKSELVIGPLALTSFAVRHAGLSYAYRIKAGASVFCFSGDSGVCPGLEEAARGADLFLCECSALEGEEVEDHLTATQVGVLAQAAGCKEVVLTHLYEDIIRSNPIPRVTAHFSGRVSLAEDGMSFAL
jgi:ribonuclease BN (tRNA processing enzyme)